MNPYKPVSYIGISWLNPGMRNDFTIRFQLFALCFTLATLLAGCTPTRQTPAPQRPAPQTDEPVINRLLDSARAAFNTDRLTTPEGDNAHQYYRQVLAFDAGNPAALEGISAIVETYLTWAMARVERGQYSRARLYLNRASTVDDSHPNIGPVLNMIRESEEKITIDFALDPRAVRGKRPEGIGFDRIANRIEQESAFVTIRAPDDASGRWLYQELNRRVSFRIEARFERASRPSISLAHQPLR